MTDTKQAGTKDGTSVVTPDHKAGQLTVAQSEKILARMRLGALKSRMQDRLDRCCHGGVVGLRLPLSYRIDCANGAFR